MRILLIMLSISLATAGIGQSLEDYLVMAADSNSALRSSYYEYQASLERVPQVTSLPDPEAGFGFFIRPVETRVGPQWVRFSVMQMFPWFGTLPAKGEVQAQLAKAKFETFEQQRDDLFYKVRAAYYHLYEVKYSLSIVEENIKILKTYESLATTNMETGSGSMVDVLRIQLEIAELENKLFYLQESIGPLTITFNQLLNRDSSLSVNIPDTLYAQDLALERVCIADSIQANNDILAALQHRQEAMISSKLVAQKSGAPSIGVGLTYIYTGKRKDMDVNDNGKDPIMPMVTLKVPIYRKKYNAQVKESELALVGLENSEEEQRTKLFALLSMAFLEYDDAGRRIDLYRDQVITVDQAINLMVEAYSTDGKDFEEVLRLQRKRLDYQLKLVEAVVDRNVIVAKVRSWM